MRIPSSKDFTRIALSTIAKWGGIGRLLAICIITQTVFATLLLALCEAGARSNDDANQESFVEQIPGTLVKFDMVKIPAGTVEIADPTQNGARRKVDIKTFWIGKTEVTWDEYDVFALRLDLPEKDRKADSPDAKSRPSKPYGAPDRGFGHHGYPAISISHFAAGKYCDWLSEKTGKQYRIPTEAEWEYACRSGGTDVGPFTDAMELGKFGWFFDNADDTTHPVMKKTPTEWGLFDMLGNAAEWCTGFGKDPAVRGGSFEDDAKDVHSAARKLQTPAWNARDPQVPQGKWWLTDGQFCGFRLVYDGQPAVKAAQR